MAGDEGVLGGVQRQVSRVVSFGIVSEVKGAMVRVAVGRNFTPLVPFMALRAGAVRVYSPPCVGEQVVVFSPGGDFEGAVAGPSLFCDSFPAPDVGDGVFIDAHGVTVHVSGDGVTIKGDVSIEGNVSVRGSVSVEGDVAASGDVTAGSVSLVSHTHGGVQGGSGSTSGPR